MDESYRTLMQVNKLEVRLLNWRLAYCQRDGLVHEAHEAGLANHRIAALMGLSRQTVSRIVENDSRALRQAPR